MLLEATKSLQLTPLQPYNQQNKPSEQNIQQIQESRPCLWFFLSWLIFIVCVGVYGGIWAISTYAVTIQGSYYYNVDYPVSPYLQANQNILFCDQSVGTDRSINMYTADTLTTTQAIALSLVFSWLMWKLPFALFMLHLIWESTNKILKYVSWAISLSIMLAADIVLTIYLPTIYQDLMFFGLAALLTVIISVLNNRPGCLIAFFSAILPYFYITLLYFLYSYIIPAVFNILVKGLDPGYQYVFIYGYPILDLILYAGLLFINSRDLANAKPILAVIHFYLIGYGVGITLLASMTQVQFYYLVMYFLFRNFFVNWIMWKWEAKVNNPSCLPGWAILYYLSYIFNFLPIIGLGPLVLSKSFKSQQFSQSCLLLSYFPSTQYPYTISTPLIDSGSNISLAGFIFWPAALILWVATTFTQQYSRRKPTPFDLPYNLLGIYLFYLGISAGLQLLTLRQVAIF